MTLIGRGSGSWSGIKKPFAFCLLLATALAVAGCGSTPTKKKKGDEDEFYEGRERTLYQTGKEAKTTEEAFKRGKNALAGGDTDRAFWVALREAWLTNLPLPHAAP